MKKTLTINLGGRVFHIDEDAYRLLDKYLSNLKYYFRKEEGADEIVKDIEQRISELFTEKVDAGMEVITIEYVEEVISRMGNPEDISECDEESEKASSSATGTSYKYTSAPHRLYRDPDNKILGGVASGIAAYFDWDPTAVRLAFILLAFFGFGTFFLVYIICWLVIPEARTASEKLSMRGEQITVENIGKTVKDSFDKVSGGVNDFVKSDKPRTILQKIGDVIVQVIGILMKIILVLLAVFFAPVFFALFIVFITLIITAIALVFGGGVAIIHAFPFIDGAIIGSMTPAVLLASSISGIILVGIPLGGFVFAILRSLFHWKPMASGVKWGLVILWIIALVLAICLFPHWAANVPWIFWT